MRLEPLAEQVLHLVRQAQHRVARRARAGARGRLEQRLELVVGERRYQRRRHDAHVDARGREAGDGLEAARRRRGARLEPPREAAIERRHRQEDPRHAPPRHRPEDVGVAQHQRGLGDDRHRMVVLRQQLEQRAGDAQPALRRLVGVRVGPEGDRRGPVARPRELGAQQARGVGLEEDPRLEVEPRGQAEPAMGRPRVAVDASMLAAAIGIDRAVEGDVGRIVARDDAAARVGRQRRRGARRVLLLLLVRAGARPAVVHRDAPERLEPAVRVGDRAAALARAGMRFLVHRREDRRATGTNKEHRAPRGRLQ